MKKLQFGRGPFSVFLLALLVLGFSPTPSVACTPCGAASFCPLGPGLCAVCSQCQIPFFPPGSPTTSPDFLGLNSPFLPRSGDAGRSPFNGTPVLSNGANGSQSGSNSANGGVGGGSANGLGNNLTTAFQGQSAVAPNTGSTVVRPVPPGLPGYFYQPPPTASRQAILGRVRGTGDIALAAELLARENVIVYDQSGPNDINNFMVGFRGGVNDGVTRDLSNQLYSKFIQGANADNLLDVTRGNCYDFLHFSAYMAGSGTGNLQAGGSQLQDLIDPGKMQKWDGTAMIPRGKIIVGTVKEEYDGQGEYGLYHVAVSLGNGMVAHNLGSGVAIDPIGDVFDEFYTGSKTGRGVYFGDYVGYKNPDNARDFLTRQRDNNKDVMALYENGSLGGDLTPGQRTALINDFQSRNVVIEYQLGNTPKPGDDVFTPSIKPYVLFLGQAVTGITNHDPYVIAKFETYTLVQQTTKTSGTTATSPASSQATPKQPPEGLDLAKLFVDYFNISEAGQLPTPQPKGP
jgi:hypothetical protein